MPAELLKPIEPIEETLGDGNGPADEGTEFRPGEVERDRNGIVSSTFSAVGMARTAEACVVGIDGIAAGGGTGVEFASFSGEIGLRGFKPPGMRSSLVAETATTG